MRDIPQSSDVNSSPRRIDPSIRIVPISRGDLKTAAAILAEAFKHDPHSLGLLPPHLRAHPVPTLRLVFREMTRECLRAGGHAYFGTPEDSPKPLGVALWDPPGAPVGGRASVTSLPAYMRAFRLRSAIVTYSQMTQDRHHPEAPHWYLRVLGTVPEARGRGVGKVLTYWGVDRAEEDRVGMYLEASSEDNVT